MICATQGLRLKHIANEPKSMVMAILNAMIGRFVCLEAHANVLIDWL
jgi:hypothetical protein